MIKVEYRAAADVTLRVTGHALFDEEGRDIVCAAASILVYTVADAAGAWYRSRRLRTPPVIRLDTGDAEVCIAPKKRFEKEIRTATDALVAGLALLQKTYPEFVHLYEGETDGRDHKTGCFA